MAPDIPAKMKMRIVIAFPKIRDTLQGATGRVRHACMPGATKTHSICRAVVMPPSCVKTTQPIVENRKMKVAQNSARTAWMLEGTAEGKGMISSVQLLILLPHLPDGRLSCQFPPSSGEMRASSIALALKCKDNTQDVGVPIR